VQQVEPWTTDRGGRLWISGPCCPVADRPQRKRIGDTVKCGRPISRSREAEG